ncbi:RNA polymerase sigma factor [Sphingobium tyrosinilyticum]|uniref:RNA polymerase sigma factor n=1 Tax=Sphingobium tyrosinilyticum TaxID=2715436 RepID=A0ABV9F0I7_9SPHN
MSSKPSNQTASKGVDPGETNIAFGGSPIHLGPLLREIAAALRKPLFGRFWPMQRRRYAALADDIDRLLQQQAPTPLSLATAEAVQLADIPPGVRVDVGQTNVMPTAAGVWVHAQFLVDWSLILPSLPNFARSRYVEAIAALPERQRQVFMLHRFGGLDLNEIAKRLDQDISACERALAQALASIARHIDQIDQ